MATRKKPRSGTSSRRHFAPWEQDRFARERSRERHRRPKFDRLLVRATEGQLARGRVYIQPRVECAPYIDGRIVPIHIRYSTGSDGPDNIVAVSTQKDNERYVLTCFLQEELGEMELTAYAHEHSFASKTNVVHAASLDDVLALHRERIGDDNTFDRLNYSAARKVYRDLMTSLHTISS